MRKEILLGVFIVGIAFAVAPVAADNSVTAEPQATAGDNVTIQSADIDDDGWVAVYEESVGGGPNFDSSLGAAELVEGSNSGVVVDTEGLNDHGFLVAVLHYGDDDEFDVEDNPTVEDEEGNDVQDDFFVAVGTRDIHESYASAQQQKRSLENQIQSVEDRIDALETDDADVDDEIASLEDELSQLRDDLDAIEATISETEELLNDLDDGDGDDADDADDDGDDTDDADDDDDEDDDDAEGLPGFTVAAALAALVGATFLARRQ